MRILMHMCCAGCGLYPAKSLRERGVEFRALWFNPNIHPEDEYSRRLDAVRKLQVLWGLDVRYIEYYGREEFEAAISAHNGLRCEVCYEMRLRRTALEARQMGLDGFTTSLLVSPYQKHDLLVDAGRKVENELSVPFYAWDFREGWREGRKMLRELGLYSQYYCGCFFSKAERDAGRAQREVRKRDGAHARRG